MRNALAAAAFVCVSAQPAAGQTISGGVIAGTHFTNSFTPRFESNSADAFNPANRFSFEPGGRSFIAGASLEGKLTRNLSLEANVLHRAMNAKLTFTELFPDGSSNTSVNETTPVRTWQFPVLLKYRFDPVRIAKARPFLTLGPSFRTQEDATATQPSQIGLTVGAGFTVPMGKLRLEPTLRYTRWRTESIGPRYTTKPDQLEILAGLAYETNPRARRFAGRKLELGALLGLPLASGFERIGPGEPDRDRFRYLAGLTTRVDVNDRWALQIDGIYKPLRAVNRVQTTLPDGSMVESEHRYSVLTWQFPMLATCRLATHAWMPFVAAGPSFRLAGNLNGYNPSKIGVTGAFGVERRVGVARWSSSVRYTRWAHDNNPVSTNPNALDVIIGVSF